MQTILNRDFQHPSDGWYMIEPKGEHPNADAGVVQIIDDPAAEAIVNRFNDEADALGDRFPGMLIDHEHFSHDLDKETRAFGWLTRLDNRADGIYGQIRWTATGRAAVDGGDYRFFSTEYSPASVQVLNQVGRAVPCAPPSANLKRVRPTAISGLTVTNKPNNKGGKPITNRAANSEQRTANSQRSPHDGDPFAIRHSPLASNQFAGAASAASAAQTNTNTTNRRMQSIATKLGLAAEASEDAILAEVTKIMNRATDAEAKVVPLQKQVTHLQAVTASLKEGQVESDLETYKNRFAPEQRDNIRTLLVLNREKTLEVLKAAPEVGRAVPCAPITNRATAKTPADPKPEDKSAIFNREVQDYRNSHPGCSFESAWNAVKSAKPELLK